MINTNGLEEPKDSLPIQEVTYSLWFADSLGDDLAQVLDNVRNDGVVARDICLHVEGRHPDAMKGTSLGLDAGSRQKIHLEWRGT